jgi:LacI family transcriptional regulator
MQTAAFLNPSLSTITQPAFEMGREAAAILFDLVEKKGKRLWVEKMVLNSILVERNSSKATWENSKNIKPQS